MSTTTADPALTAQPAIDVILRDLQQENIVLALPPLCLAGIVLAVNHDYLARQGDAIWPALVLAVLPFIVLGLRGRSYLAAAWTMVLGSLGGMLLIVANGHVAAAVHLLALPVGLAALFVSVPGGLVTAAAVTALLGFAPAVLLAPDALTRIIAATSVWSTVGLVWLTLRLLATTTEWSWSSYEESRRQLERARDYQVQLKQTLQDLADANLQLTRLNLLAQRLRQNAEEARRVKEQFVTNVSHELRTPLNMIVGFGEMILAAPRAYGQIPRALLADLEVIVRNSQHLAGLIDDVLDLSQIEAGQMALVRERVALRDIVESAAVAVRPLYQSKGLYLETEVPQDCLLFCDRTRIREVLVNLLSNAGRFTEQGGVRVRAWQERGDCCVSVADTGPGIAAGDAARLFQPFQQLDGSIRRRYGGTGLGLAISKSFVELHGGKMWVESTPGSGATFSFRLPFDLPAPVDAGVARWFSPYWHYEKRTRRPVAPAPVVRPRLVVLEQGDCLQRLLSRYLDHVEVVAVDSPEALSRELASTPAQAVLANGAVAGEAWRRLRESAPLLHGIPLITCSVPEVATAADSLGVASYLIKPVARGVLLATLERLKLRGKTVLIVDDEPEARQLLRRMLASARAGYRVLTASDGHQAIEALREEHPDAVLIDLVMPEMDGFRVLEAHDQDPALRDIPFVVITARDPRGQVIVSDSLAVTCAEGLSVSQLLACIEALSGILGAAGQPPDRVPPTGQSG